MYGQTKQNCHGSPQKLFWLALMSEPKLVNNRAQFTFQSDSLEKANLKARSLPGVKNINFK